MNKMYNKQHVEHLAEKFIENMLGNSQIATLINITDNKWQEKIIESAFELAKKLDAKENAVCL